VLNTGLKPVEVVVKKLLLLAGASLLMAACAESSTAPKRDIQGAKAHRDGELECRSGYVVAYDENGNPYCTPE
jgi:hypothetical protein